MEKAEGEKKCPEDKTTKRKMKTAVQLELLEKTYAIENYPSEALRADLSAKLDLTDRQLQMWFCHRRLKDRRKDEDGSSKRQKKAASEPSKDPDAMDSASRDDRSMASNIFVGMRKDVVPRSSEMPMVKRFIDLQPSVENRVIAAIEAQLGEPLREDGPALGVEFDPLPPGAFGSPLGQQMLSGRLYDGKIYERQEAKPGMASPPMPNMEHGFLQSSSSGKRKASGGNVHMVLPQVGTRTPPLEYKFLPEQPSVRPEAHERAATSSNSYDTPFEALGHRGPSLSTGGAFLHHSEPLASSYAYPSQMVNVNRSSHGRHEHSYSQGSADYDSGQHKNSLAHFGSDPHVVPHPVLGLDNPYASSDQLICADEDASRMERKRKAEEARIAKEVEAHEKRIRKELEKQDLLKRKREEQTRREMERYDRERRKEEERLVRERQREEERFQREQKREVVRRERFLQKESLRAEKMRHKEELRREKEAARLKAANERATARRIARESMELVEDERLELMELAASCKGLPSVVFLDMETLQNLELFKDKRGAFPPRSVRLKEPFTIRPLKDSEENVANLLMVWRFLITFADVLGLWPFTLDEFVQAFHDHQDSRLMGEIHIVLLKSIIKDIEDVARTPSVGTGANQNSAANPGGGHPQIVEGAYAWGFDIRSWQRHLNPLTWPEVLRQFALSAGFGPRWKEKGPRQAYFRDENEGHDGEDVVSTLRSGAAAQNAVSMMHGKGISHLRKCRHRLTPGTVKFAAFYVLSLEGSKGLTILEVADKIQKSGLRDLTTSKTPEASIAAALSRDGNLFERTAPSTYCVRPAFRKDPADRDAILQAAREKIRQFQSGFSDSEEAEKDLEDAEDVADEEFDIDEAEDPEIDDGLDGLQNSDKGLFSVNEEDKADQASTPSEEEKSEQIKDKVGKTRGVLIDNSNDAKKASILNGQPADENINEQEDAEIDESHTGESWVQGLTEGEYSDLSVEERLNALVALIGVAIEGNSIRVVLEERLEAANALKRQMWAEAQLDKRRMREEHYSKSQVSNFTGTKAEGVSNHNGAEGGQSPLPQVDNKGEEFFSATKQDQSIDAQNVQSYLHNMLSEKNPTGQELAVGQDISPYQQQAFAFEKSRAQLKAYIGHRAEELYVYRSLPLGQDRRRNRYWRFVTSSGSDPGCGRIFFESHDGCWRIIDTVEGFDALLAALDIRGIRESHLYSMLQKIESSFKEVAKSNLYSMNPTEVTAIATKIESIDTASCSVPKVEVDSPTSVVWDDSSDFWEQSKSFKIELGRTDLEKFNVLMRYEDYEKWLWTECFNSSVVCALKYGKKRCTELLYTCEFCHNSFLAKDKHCSCCHGTFKKLDTKFSQHVADCEEKRKLELNWKLRRAFSSLSSRVRLVKAELASIEVSIPSEALKSHWTEAFRKSWGINLLSLTTAEELFQMLNLLEAAVVRECLSSSYETTKDLLESAKLGYPTDETSLQPGSVPLLPWIPQTTAALALRLMEFDASIAYMMQQKSHRDRESEEFVKVPSRFAVVRSIQEVDPMESPNQALHPNHEDNWTSEPRPLRGSGRGRGSGSGRGRGRGRGRSTRGGRGAGGSRAEASGRLVGNGERARHGRGGRKGRGRGRGRGRGLIRARVKPILERRIEEEEEGREVIDSKQKSEESSSTGEEWVGEEATGEMMNYAMENEGVRSDESSEEEENEQESEDEFGDGGPKYGVGGDYDSKSEEVDGDESGDEDEERDQNGEEEDEEESGSISEYSD
ncbi:homeobox-DDT domain protein RLT2 isoform X1 [Amborella trichopoda]|uniref:homeobox-DDT domain protein RLT2 isoform X1 n=1 Tax=Amborella trichopoda TaxID=13333 RepID=UPI0005D445C6|nr:homeobox-DDT domain protein RLT2 isoform X1 [Amborella trichopoda]XP_020523176.1 homeobox-DDT domain protein RLT2 isoform X1 [Amborella trichopoda]|eukprot:XP_011623601.1 homeobox-DDT domain protein RLT2 isoform X1 [Amborella trichopoda]